MAIAKAILPLSAELTEIDSRRADDHAVAQRQRDRRAVRQRQARSGIVERKSEGLVVGRSGTICAVHGRRDADERRCARRVAQCAIVERSRRHIRIRARIRQTREQSRDRHGQAAVGNVGRAGRLQAGRFIDAERHWVTTVRTGAFGLSSVIENSWLMSTPVEVALLPSPSVIVCVSVTESCAKVAGPLLFSTARSSVNVTLPLPSTVMLKTVV